MKSLTVKTPARECFVDVTEEAARAVAEANVEEGLLTLFVPHTTAAVTINENADPDVRRDLVSFLAEMVPRSHPFRHGEGNSDAHVKASLLGASVSIPITGGRLALGTWQGVYFAEFDGPRSRKLHLVVSGEKR